MEKIYFVQATRTFAQFLSTAVTVDNTMPYAFRIDKSVSRRNTDAPLKRLTRWAKANGAEVTLIHSVETHWLVEITDPVAASLEKYLRMGVC